MKKSEMLIYIFYLIIALCKGFNLQSESSIYLYSYIFGVILICFKIFKDKYSFYDIFKIMLLLGSGFLVYILSKNQTPLFFSIAICCLKDINIKKVIKILFYCMVFTTAIMILLSTTGIIDNQIIYLLRDGNVIARYCFGYIHPNIIHMQLLLIVLMYYYLYDNKNNKILSFIFFIANIILYYFTFSRTSFYLINIFLIYQLFFSKNNNVNSILIYISKYSYILFCLSSIILSYLYDIIPVIYKIDSILTGRVYFMHKLLVNYPITLFGSSSFENILFDNSYFYLMYSCGLVFFLIYSYFICKMTSYMYKNKYNKELIFILFINALCVVENIFLSVNLNFINLFLVYIVFKKGEQGDSL